jgi:branched-chain amino acid transport system ATP-binding protein
MTVDSDESGPQLTGGSRADPVLELEGVSGGYGGGLILRDISFRVMSGQVVALLGPNGAGKTTTLRAATGIIRLSSGRVTLDSVDVTTALPHRRVASGLCLIPEGRGVFKSLTVRENMRLFMSRGERAPDDAMDRALSMFPVLDRRLNEIAGRLSGGQQQMLAIARAYVTEPKVILLDEVSMGLAPRVIDEVFEALESLVERGVSMLLVEQYISRAMAMADSVVLLNKGSVTYYGPPSGLDEEKLLQDYLGIETPTASEA